MSRPKLLFILALMVPLLWETCAFSQQFDAQPAIEIPAEPVVVSEEPPPRIWSGSVEFGLNGATGNSELFKVRIGGEVKRETKSNVAKIDWVYGFANANGEETENRGLLNGRYEWLFDDSPWSLYTSGSLEYDEFKAFDIRLSSHTGVGYQWIKTDATQLKTRLGAGGSQEIGGPDNRFMPEADVGLDFEHKISDRQKFSTTVDVFPDLGDFGDYRVVARAHYELLIDPVWNLTLKLGVLDRYDSTPDGKKRNDIEYFAVLLWSF